MGRELVADRYEIVEVLGHEGATEVIHAVDTQNDRAVALKLRHLSPDVSRDEVLAEGRALLGVRSHPALPTVRDAFFLDESSYVLVMDLVEGTSLGRFITERGDPGLPLGTVLSGLEVVAGALDHLHVHTAPVIHGDVRPENVLVGPGGRITLVYGVGSTGSASAGFENPYRAPELAREAPSRAADVYGMAATAVFALTGSPPPRDGAIDWSGIAPELAKRIDRVIRRALDPDPSRRPPSAPDFVERLAATRELAVPSGVVTFVLTDVEGSTDLWEAHADVMAKVMMRHYELAGDVAEAYGGRMPRSQGEGDSTLTAYARATDAIDATLAFQRAVQREPWPKGIVLRVRSGIHTGEAQVEHGDYFGAALNRAARVRSLARGGQILLSQATAELVVDRLPEGCELDDLGQVQLKGLERAEELYQLRSPDLPQLRSTPELVGGTRAASRLPLPTTLAPDRTPFVDRVAQLAAFRAHWTEAIVDSRRHLILVSGEAGIGKSRFTTEVAREVHANAGATVLHGRCYEENVVPYQPFVEVLEHIVRNGPPSEVRTAVVNSGTLLTRILPDLALRFPDLPEPVHAEPGTERYLLFEAVNSMLSALATGGPLLVVLDDLHWADRPTVALVSHLARSPHTVPLVLLGTFRSDEVGSGHPLATALADLRRDVPVEEIELGGLQEREVAELVRASGLEAESEFLRSVSRETAGNPFFIREICSHVAESGGTAEAFTLETLGVPEGVKQVIGRRIARLPDDVARLLTFGAVIGREFDLDVLMAVAGTTDEDEVLDLLDQACAVRLLEEVPGRIGRFAFVHALTREALYEGSSAVRRARLHRRVAEVLESEHGSHLDEHLGELAYHFSQAGAETPKAVEYARRAGDQALTRLAHEEAADYYARGLALLRVHDVDRCDLLLGLAEARRRAGDVPGSQSAFADAGALARELGDAERLARAAIGNFRGHVMATPQWHAPTVTLLEEALSALSSDDSSLRSRVLAALALELYFTSARERGIAVSTESVAMARRIGDDDALAFALACKYTAFSDPDHLADRLDTSVELVTVGERLGNAELGLVGHVQRACDLLEQAQVDEASREAAAAIAIVDELGQPIQRYYVVWLQSTLALLAGRFADAERFSNEVFDIAIAAGHPDAFVVRGTQALVLAWQRGETEPLLEPARRLLDELPELTTWPAAVALVEATSGHVEEARARLLEMARDLDALELGATWMGAMLALGEVARIADEPSVARCLYERLLPYADRICVISLSLSEFGPVSRGLGVLATLGRDFSAAEDHFEHALDVSHRIGAPAHLARTSVDCARMLLARGGEGDATRARELVDAARTTATDLGMSGLLTDIAALSDG